MVRNRRPLAAEVFLWRSRRHVPDIRLVDATTAQSVMATVVRVAHAVSTVFPNDGLSVWHSASEGANQEVPHLHFHVHPRRIDGVKRWRFFLLASELDIVRRTTQR